MYKNKIIFKGIVYLLTLEMSKGLWAQVEQSFGNFKTIQGSKKINISALSLDGVRSPLIAYTNQSSEKTIIFLPDSRETLQLKLAEWLKEDFNILLTSNRLGKVFAIKHMGGYYSHYQKYYRKKFPIHRRRTLLHHTPYLWDYDKMKGHIPKTGNTIFFLTDFSLRHLLEQNIYKPQISNAVIVSPSYDILYKKINFFVQNPNILWMGSVLEETKLKAFQDKYGGEYKIYPRAGRNMHIFFRHVTAFYDLKDWLKQ